MIDAFLSYLKDQVENHSIYVWGAQGQRGTQITEAWIRRKETSAANADRVIRFWTRQVKAGFGPVLAAYDCSGLGMYFFQNLHHILDKDLNADGMRGLCGVVGRSELKPGDWVFRTDDTRRAYHIGYMIDGSTVIHARGRDYGVVREQLDQNGPDYWNAYGRPRIYTAYPRILKLTTPMMRGGDVVSLQTVLHYLGCKPGEIDGIFGQKTEAALKLFQARAQPVSINGILDDATRIALNLDS